MESGPSVCELDRAYFYTSRPLIEEVHAGWIYKFWFNDNNVGPLKSNVGIEFAKGDRAAVLVIISVQE